MTTKQSIIITGTNFTPFTLEDLYNQYEGQYKYNLSSACMPAMSLENLMGLYSANEQERFKEEILKTKLDYSEQYGAKKLLDALAKNLYKSLDPNSFLVTTGASEAIYLVMNTLFNKGDSIIVQKPIYQSLYQIAEDNGMEIIDWDIDLKTMTWDFNKLEDLVYQNPNSKALVINNPNNPVGTVFQEDELKEIIELLNGRCLISDEVFLPISLKPSKAVAEIYEYGISVSDLSKSFNMPGLRLGWIGCNSERTSRHPERQRRISSADPEILHHSVPQDDVLEKFSSYKNYLSLRNNTLSELIAPWLLNKSIEITTKNKKLIQENLNWIYSQDPDSLFFDLSQKTENISNLCFFPKLNKDLNFENLIEQGFLLAFGDNFGSKYKSYCRIGLGNDAKMFFQ